MTTLNPPADQAVVWLPLAEAAAALHCSVDTVRRRLKRGEIESKIASGKYLIRIEGQPAPAPTTQALQVIEEVHPSIRVMLDYLRERDQQRDQEIAVLREELARARADAAAAQAALPPGKPWGPFAWMRQLWAGQQA